MFEQDLFTYWKTHPSLGAGTPPIGLWPGKLPGNSGFPAATYQRISAPTDNEVHDTAPTEITARYQFSIYDDDWLTCWAAAKRVRTVFRRYRGTIGSTEVKSSRIENDNDSGDPESGLPRRLIDVMIRIREA